LRAVILRFNATAEARAGPRITGNPMLFKLSKPSELPKTAISGSAPDPSSALNASMEALLEQMIDEIPTVFGRLTYLASLFDGERETYRHPILGQLMEAPGVDRMLRTAHRRVFLRWLEFSLRQQTGDITRYLGFGSLGHALLRQLRDRDAFRMLPPPGTASHERVLFSSDLAVIINSELVDFNGSSFNSRTAVSA
jgi:hypothetical protein